MVIYRKLYEGEKLHLHSYPFHRIGLNIAADG